MSVRYADDLESQGVPTRIATWPPSVIWPHEVAVTPVRESDIAPYAAQVVDASVAQAEETGTMPLGMGISLNSCCNVIKTSSRIWRAETKASICLLEALDLTYKRRVSVKGETKDVAVINKVCAKASPGEILAICGPSGAGKTTFMDALAGRISFSSLQGNILVNGVPADEAYCKRTGYVMQSDQLFPMLTVRETLMYSAKLRISNKVTKLVKDARVESVILELGLSHCADTIIGNEQVRGVSGGEKRRVSIGVDLIHDPSVLFLDEPTSGLDSTSALNVVQILKDLAEQQQRTIVLTIHQPSFRILECIHNFLLLASGTVVYHGPYADMALHFTTFTNSPAVTQANSLEYAMDVVERAAQRQGELESLFQYAQLQSALKHRKQQSQGPTHTDPDTVLIRPPYATGFFSELGVLTARSFKTILRTKELFLLRLATFAICSLFVGLLYRNISNDPSGLQDRFRFFAFSLMAQIFTAVDALPIFLAEREIFIRECSRGAYRTSSYVIAGMVAYLPFLLLTSLTAIIPYFIIGLAPTAFALFVHTLCSFTTLCVSNSFILAFAGFVPNYAIGVTLSTAANAFFFLCSGFFISSSKIPVFLIWINWISSFKYPLQIQMVNQLDALPNVCWDPVLQGEQPITDLSECTLTSEEVLASYDMQGTSIWTNFAVMAAMFFAYRFLFYVLLLRHIKSSRK